MKSTAPVRRGTRGSLALAPPRLVPFLAVVSAIAMIVSTGAAQAQATTTAGKTTTSSAAPQAATTAATPPTSAASTPVQRPSGSVTADALPTVQIDGVVWSEAVVGNTVYAGGDFANARPAGSAVGVNNVARTDLLAFDITTGNLITSFDPVLNGAVQTVTVSPDSTRLYIGGNFTTVNGLSRPYLAAFNTSTGALVPNFAPSVGSQVNAITASNSAVYFGGFFTTVDGVQRDRVAAVNASDGSLTGWNPDADYSVKAMVLSPDGSRVIIGGSFQNVGGQPAYGMASIDAVTGALQPWQATQTIRDAGPNAAIESLTTDGTAIFGTTYEYNAGSQGNFEGSFSANPSTGALNWIADCHGDTYDSFPINGLLYTVGHSHFCSDVGGFPETNPRTIHRTTAFTTQATGTLQHYTGSGTYTDFGGFASPSLAVWTPDLTIGTYTQLNQAAWSVTGNSSYLVLGGEFPTVNGTAQQGLVRFATSSKAPNLQGPMVTGSNFAPKLTSLSTGSVRVGFQLNYDRDDRDLTYSVYRNGNTTTPVWTRTLSSEVWNRPDVGFTDSGLSPGGTYNYRIFVSDPSGNLVKGNSTYITLPKPVPTPSTYAQDVSSDGAQHYWRFNEPTAGTAYDTVAYDDLTEGTGIKPAAGAAVGGTTGTSAALDGTANSSAYDPVGVTSPTTFSLETWFKTTSITGGRLVGLSTATTGTSVSTDRQLYLSNSGQVYFGIYDNTHEVVDSPRAYNDGQWHHVVATEGSGGSTLWVDGTQVAASSTMTAAHTYYGYWRVGADTLAGWQGAPTSNYLTGNVDDVAIYPTALSGSQIQKHYNDAGRVLSIAPAPTDSYGAAVYADQPNIFWRLDDASSTVAGDTSTANNPGVITGTVTPQVPSPVAPAGYGMGFNGSTGTIGSSRPYAPPSAFSEEAWFNTTTTKGGKIVGFGNAQSGNSTTYDRHVYLTPTGQVVFGVYSGARVTITSPSSYNDGQWHQVVATQGPSGMALYLDGALIGSNTTTTAQAYSGYWRVGGDAGWLTGTSSNYLNGAIDEVSIYLKALTASQVRTHYQASSVAQGTGSAPTASFTSSTSGATVAVDGSGSSDSNGTVSSYSWSFGDGSAGTGVTTSHSYAVSGSYTVTMTVTDNQGATGSTSKTVQVTVPDQPPVASFTATPTNLSVAFDGSASSDPDGSIASYSWNFGDGSSAGSGASPTYGYAAAGSYTVTLTVTDNQGATGSASHTVTVTAPANQPPTASFTSTPTNLSVAFDASRSTDDGTIVSYAWTFGDNSSGTGVQPTHQYASTGLYPVVLMVTDNQGATSSATGTVQVATTGATVYGADSFTRSVTSGWGSADTGGAWTLSGLPAASYTVNAGAATMATSAGVTGVGYLTAISQANVVERADVSLSTIGDAGGTYAYLHARRTGSTFYRLKLWVTSAGGVQVFLTKVVSNTETVLASTTLQGLTYTASTVLRVQLGVTGTSPTTLTAKVWPATSTEPAANLLSVTDSTSTLQSAGNVGLGGYVSAKSTIAPVVSFDNLSFASA